MQKELNYIDKEIDFNKLPDIKYEFRYTVKVLNIFEAVAGVVVLRIDRPADFNFQPGQYVWLVLPSLSSQKGVVDRRAYSIASGKDENFLEFLIRLTGSEYLDNIKKIKEGDMVEIIGPMGGTFVTPENGAIVISGGTGVAPFLSAVRSRLNNKISLYVFSSKERPFYARNEIEQIAEIQKYTVKFFTGKVILENIRSVSAEKDNRPIFISGPQLFVNEVFQQLLILGIKRERMFFEACYPEDNKIKNTQEIFRNFIVNKVPSIPLDNIFFQIASQTSNHVIFTDPNGLVLYANEAAENMTGYSLNEMLGQTPRLWGGLMPKNDYEQALWKNLKDGLWFKHAMLNRRKDGVIYVALASITPIFEGKNIIGYVATEEDITELRNLDKTKTEIISLAAHQLRTPLTAINWYTEMVLSGDMGEVVPNQKKYLEEIFRSNKRMIDLVNNLLNVSRIELGTLKIELAEVDMKEVVESVLLELQPQIFIKKIILEKKYNSFLPSIFSDVKLLRIVLQNLIGNAVKYVGTGGRVVLELSSESGEMSLKVWNNGLGIPKEAQSKIFTKLFRDDLAREREPDGNGLGLYISKSITENLGGKIWFDSPSKNVEEGVESSGVAFYLKIPINSGEKKENTT